MKYLKSQISTSNISKFKAELVRIDGLIAAYQSRLMESGVGTIRKEEASNRERLAKMRDVAITKIKEGYSAEEVTRTLSLEMRDFLKDLYSRGVVGLREQGFGDPPCDFSFEVFGSLARLESGPYPDIDCMMVVAEKTPENVRYFEKLNQHVADKLYRLGESSDLGKTGLRFCEGGLSPPFQKYESRYAETSSRQGIPELVAEPSSDNPLFMDSSGMSEEQKIRVQDVLMAASEISFVAGSEELHDKYVAMHQKVRASSHSAVESLSQFVKGLEADGSPIVTQSIPELLYVKGDLYRFPQVTISHLAEIVGIEETNTFERLKALIEKGVFEKDYGEQLLAAIEQLVKFRFLTQSSYGEEFELVSTGDWEGFKSYRKQLLQEIESLKKEPPSEETTNKIRSLEAPLGAWTKVAEHEFIQVDPSEPEERLKKPVLSQAELDTLRNKTILTLNALYKMVKNSVSSDEFAIDAFESMSKRNSFFLPTKGVLIREYEPR